MNILSKSRSGLIWTILDLFLNKAVFFVSTLILARLLGPETFGIIGIITIFFTIGNIFVDSGLSVSLLKLQDPTREDYNSIFFLNIIIAVIVYLLVIVIAPYIAQFYVKAELSSLIRIYSIGFVIGAFKLVPQTKLLKELQFKKITILSIPGNLLSLIISVTLAIKGFGVWSVIALYLSNQFISTILFFFNCNWFPSFEVNFNTISKHWKFGYKLMLAAQLNTIFENIYNLIIGKYFSIKSLGFYERAISLNNYPVQILSGITNKVALPIFSSLLNDKNKLTNYYKTVANALIFISIPLMFTLIALAKHLFLLILGSEWLPSAKLFQISCISFMFYPLHSLNINLLSIFGRSDLFLKLEVVKKILLVLTVIVSVRLGLEGLVWGSVFISVLGLFINSYYTGKLTYYSTKDQLYDLLPITILSILMSILITFTLNFLDDYINSEILKMTISVLVGLLLFASISIVFKFKAIKDFRILLNK